MGIAVELPGLIERLVTARQDDAGCLHAINHSTDFSLLSDDLHAECRQQLAGYVAKTDLLNDAPNNFIFASSLLASRFGDRAGLDALAYLFHLAQQSALKNTIFWNIVRYASMRSISYDREIAGLYFELLRAWPIEKVNLGGCPPLDFDSVVVVTQLLNLQHAPTADAIDYVRILRQLGYRPLVINTNELPEQTGLPLIDAFAANKRSDLTGMMTLDTDNESFPLFTPPAEMPSREGLALTAALIRTIDPRLCIKVGGFSLLQEELGEIAPSVIFPTSTNLVPSRRCASVLFNDLSESDRVLMADQGIGKQNIFDGYRYSYRLPVVKPQAFERSQFGADASDFVIAIVGNRLSTEVDREFRSLLMALRAHIPQAKILFVGPLDSDAQHDIRNQLGDAAAFLAYANDLCSLYRCCNLYLNPRRSGGGTSAALALAAGIPAYSLNTGDVARILPQSFVFEKPDALVSAVVELAETSNHSYPRDLAYKSWSIISDRFSFVKDVLHRMGQCVAEESAQ